MKTGPATAPGPWGSILIRGQTGSVQARQLGWGLAVLALLAGAQEVGLQSQADLLHRLVLDLPHALLGDPDDLPDLLERHRLLDLAGLETEAVLDHRPLDISQIGLVVQDDPLDLLGRLALEAGPLGLEEVGLLQLRV